MNELFRLAHAYQMYRLGKSTGLTGLLGIFASIAVLYYPVKYWNEIVKWLHTSELMAPIMQKTANASDLAVFTALILTGIVLIFLAVIAFFLALYVFAFIALTLQVGSVILAKVIIKIFNIQPKTVIYKKR
ncbi:hypothetical protein [Ectobacillus antri]|uniref:hypothetical protein n=1 Tax=Ectobacillus antri TaxID=2486280 RepID=UPI000F5B1A92|nr:hypothetical protein [Ectobacillus antri]